MLLLRIAYATHIGPVLTVIDSNFSSKLTQMFTTQARALIRRMREGFSAGAAHAEENNSLRPSDKLLEKMGKRAELLASKIQVDLSTTGLKDLKSDREFLSKVSQVRGECWDEAASKLAGLHAPSATRMLPRDVR